MANTYLCHHLRDLIGEKKREKAGRKHWLGSIFPTTRSKKTFNFQVSHQETLACFGFPHAMPSSWNILFYVPFDLLNPIPALPTSTTHLAIVLRPLRQSPPKNHNPSFFKIFLDPDSLALQYQLLHCPQICLLSWSKLKTKKKTRLRDKFCSMLYRNLCPGNTVLIRQETQKKK